MQKWHKVQGGLAALLLIGCGIGFLGGCSSLSAKKTDAQTEMLEPAAMLKFSDIPVPNGFKSLPRESTIFYSDSFRAALIRYQGSASPDQVVLFFKDRMPSFQWQLVNMVEFGERVLNFEKTSESCIVKIAPRGSGSDITIIITPRSKRSATVSAVKSEKK
jgi:hypothetical protein